MIQKRRTTIVRQHQIINAARKLIVRYGSEHITTRRIAKEIGISEGAIYRHFKSKREILSALVDEIEEDLPGDINTAVGEDGHASLDSVLRNHILAIETRRGVSFQVMAEIISMGDKRLNRKILDAIHRYLARLKELLSNAVVNGEVRDDIDLDSAAMLLFGIVQGLVNVWTLSNYDFDPEERFTRIWDILHVALVKKSTGQHEQISGGCNSNVETRGTS